MLPRCHRHFSDLSPLGGLGALRSLSLEGCDGLRSCAPLAYLTALTSLELEGCDHLDSLLPLRGLLQLEYMTLPEGGLHVDFYLFTNHTKLQRVETQDIKLGAAPHTAHRHALRPVVLSGATCHRCAKHSCTNTWACHPCNFHLCHRCATTTALPATPPSVVSESRF